jgi:hypothetical protein
MTHIPTTFATQNSHRLVVYQPDRRGTDFDRVEDIAADAIAATRAAVAALDDLPYEIFKPFQTHEKILRDAVERRRILTDDIRLVMEEMLRHLARLDPDDATAALLERLVGRLRDALEGSHRVADLLAAERDIGWHRGIGR